ncbi:hypothetical protein [Bacillus sp. FJAT-27225]|uniref:hypothetical protein n=1 Tax=Bacillus sp. FJAT-27225 TaxID=1743144 RepID=UPI003F8894C6
MIVGLLLFQLAWIMEGYETKPIVLLGFISFSVGFVFSFIAISKQERGTLKFISLIFFFVVLFLITWLEPFQLVRIITWFKNIS